MRDEREEMLHFAFLACPSERSERTCCLPFFVHATADVMLQPKPRLSSFTYTYFGEIQAKNGRQQVRSLRSE